MTDNKESPNRYDPLYATFDSPLMEQVRREAYGEDIGQHSWVTADELRSDIERLDLNASSRLLDLGCGPCGPLVFAVRASGCRGIGLDTSVNALVSGNARAAAFGVQERVELLAADLNLPLPFSTGCVDAIISLDVVLHLRDRKSFMDEAARLVAPAGKLLFTDAGVITGPVSNEERSQRSATGYAQFVPPGFNEEMLDAAGFRLIAREDRTASVLGNASGRLKARLAHQTAIEELEDKKAFAHQQRYLETVIELSDRRALTRVMYFAEVR